MDDVYHSTDHSNKRIRLSSPDDTPKSSETLEQHARLNTNRADEYTDTQTQKEVNVGITEYVASDVAGFSGIFKKRYTDFLINEVLPSGEVLHLRNAVEAQSQSGYKKGEAPLNPQKQSNEESRRKHSKEDAAEEAEVSARVAEPQVEAEGNGKVELKEISSEDRTQLRATFDDDDDLVSSMVTLWNKIAANPRRRTRDFKTLASKPIDDKAKRTQTHQLVRRIFNSLLETKTVDNNVINISAAPKSDGTLHQSNPERRRRGNPSWSELGGEYLHFTLYKENKDTMEVISYLASRLKLNPKHFQFAGTKDRRGIAVQRVSVYRVDQERLVAVGKTLRNATIGDFEYRPAGLELGQLNGNEFGIVLRDCHFQGEESEDIEKTIELSLKSTKATVDSLRERGFINYYGLQRFGSFAVGTHVIGLKLLQGDLEGAANEILLFNKEALAAAENGDSTAAISSDDKARATALNIWTTTSDAKASLEKLPRKFIAEANLVRHLGHVDRKSGQQNRKTDYQGAFMGIPRNLRLMYVHAYQSLVWNVCAGYRWRLCGSKVVKGDLVLVHEHRDKEERPEGTEAPTHHPAPATDEPDDVILPLPTGTATGPEDRMTNPDNTFIRARALTQEEADSGRYTVFDIVLPQPGFDVLYPANEVGEYYKSFMASERGGGLDPHDMRRSWKDISLSGGYRKLLARPKPDMRFEIKAYERDDEQLVLTDLDRLRGAEERQSDGKSEAVNGDSGGGGGGGGGDGAGAGAGAGATSAADKADHDDNGNDCEMADGENDNDTRTEDEKDGKKKKKKIALVIALQLGTSQYATMALRELMKSGIITYKPDYGAGR